jgi:hypothetical protein
MPKTERKLQPVAAPDTHDRYETHAAVAASKLDLNNLDLEERAFLGTCQDLYRNDRGCGTPFENFIKSIIRWTTWGNPPKMEDLICEIKDNFEPDWDLTVHSVKRFLQNYPELVRSFQEGGEGAQATPDPPAPEQTSATRKGTTGHPGARKQRKKAGRAAA